MNALELREVTRVHGHGPTAVRALDRVGLCVRPGQLLVVLGPSGAGKSTLLRLAGGLDAPTDGRVVVAGVDLGSVGQDERAELRRRHIGYVFQDFNLIPALTATENVALPRELDGVRAGQARGDALDALRTIGIDEVGDRFPDELSGGQRQRVAIARALVGDRRLLLADEPTGALDSRTGEAVLDLIRARCDAGAACVLVTHDARHAVGADQCAFLRDGVLTDTPSVAGLVTGAS